MLKEEMQEISIAGRKIGPLHPPFVVCELSANHNGSLDQAIRLIEIAKKIGADAVKIQTYTPDTITLDTRKSEFQITEGAWAGKTLYELYEWAHTPWDWHQALFDVARDMDIVIFSSPFDHSAVDFLETLKTPAYKIASFEAVDLPLIHYAAKTKKPLIISTGMANKVEIEEAIRSARNGGCNQIGILHCVSGYPASSKDYNLRTLTDMLSSFEIVAGLSDHTLSHTTAIAAISLGASIIEKHLTLDRTAGGPDDFFSLEPQEFEELIFEIRTAWEALGTVSYDLSASESSNIKFRRSLYFVKDLSAGDIISNDAIRSIRPGYGLKPKYRDQVIGKNVKRNIKKNSPVKLTDLT
ncbi:MAG: pseudaminic acid synthase [Aestuariivita sp.]|nr:pseudaminic acid synthase [Aestuariivita sp.]